MTAEDGLADTIRPRLDAAGADVSRIVALQAVRSRDDRGEYDRQLDLARDIRVIEQAVSQLNDCRLIVIDPISAYLGDTDSHNNTEVRRVLAPLAELAEKAHVASIRAARGAPSVTRGPRAGSVIREVARRSMGPAPES